MRDTTWKQKNMSCQGGRGRDPLDGLNVSRQTANTEFQSTAVKTSKAMEGEKRISFDSLQAYRANHVDSAATSSDHWRHSFEADGDDMWGRAEAAHASGSLSWQDYSSKRIAYSQNINKLQNGKNKGKATPLLKFSIKPLSRVPPAEDERPEGNFFLEPKVLPPVHSGHRQPKFTIKPARLDSTAEDDATEPNEGDGTMVLAHRLQALVGEAPAGKRNDYEQDPDHVELSNAVEVSTHEDGEEDEDILDFDDDYESGQENDMEENPNPSLMWNGAPFAEDIAVRTQVKQLFHGQLLPAKGFQEALQRVVEKERKHCAAIQRNASIPGKLLGGLLEVRIISTSVEAHVTKCLCHVLRCPQSWVPASEASPSIYVLFPTHGPSDFELVPNLKVRLFPPWRELDIPSSDTASKVVLCTTRAASI